MGIIELLNGNLILLVAFALDLSGEWVMVFILLVDCTEIIAIDCDLEKLLLIHVLTLVFTAFYFGMQFRCALKVSVIYLFI